jgi:hypothetical protein
VAILPLLVKDERSSRLLRGGALNLQTSDPRTILKCGAQEFFFFLPRTAQRVLAFLPLPEEHGFFLEFLVHHISKFFVKVNGAPLDNSCY